MWGEFFVTGIPEGNYQLRLSLWGFALALTDSRIDLRPGNTYLFPSPLNLPLGSRAETVTITEKPIPCVGSVR